MLGQTPPAPAATDLQPALRGLQILQIAFVISLAAAVTGGAAHAYLMNQIMSSGGSFANNSLMSLISGAWQLVGIGTALAELVALVTIAGAPKESGIAEVARPAIVLQAIGLLMDLLQHALPYLQNALGGSMRMVDVMTKIGYVDSALSVIGNILMIETLLRLRRFAQPEDQAVADSESLWRGGLIAVILARLLVGYGSYAIAMHFFDMHHGGYWAAFAIRLPLTLVFYGAFLGLIAAVTTAVQKAKPASATAATGAPAAGAASTDTSAAGYRNMLFGAMWAIGGTALTLLSYQTASAAGGRYVIAYGAIIAGIFQFIRGMTQLGGRK